MGAFAPRPKTSRCCHPSRPPAGKRQAGEHPAHSGVRLRCRSRVRNMDRPYKARLAGCSKRSRQPFLVVLAQTIENGCLGAVEPGFTAGVYIPEVMLSRSVESKRTDTRV